MTSLSSGRLFECAGDFVDKTKNGGEKFDTPNSMILHLSSMIPTPDFSFNSLHLA